MVLGVSREACWLKFKRTNREELAINITPLIDVVFLLLIFFMVTTTFTRESRLIVTLPEADTPLVDSQTDVIEIVVLRDGSYAINGRSLVNSRIETLMRGLELESGGDRSLAVLLIADAQATHQSVVTAMDGIGQSGFTRLNIATQRPSEEADADQF
jgi:biopolymer transport protein ExbD|tara:strand:+ start:209 stop:679 length:471 start_codon:yes stop_codon:yes gene_type:complete